MGTSENSKSCVPDGSYTSPKTKPDPREQQIDDEFLARNYRQDSSGRFHTQPTPTSSMFPPQNTSSNRSTKSEQKQEENPSDAAGHRVELVQLKPPTLVIDGSGSTASSTSDSGKLHPASTLSGAG
uniref:Uncharacterized protein n=1 Tax=Psilocybe cubensis TaxID=181762 RepID=A0A8H7Y3V8_PSICU